MAEEKKQASTFAVLKNVDVSKQKSKKMGLDYLSWAYAWNFMKEFDKDSSLEYTKFKQVNSTTFEPIVDSDEVPYCVTPQGTYVEAIVTIKNHSEKQLLPVMDYKNRAVKNPDMMQINKAMQRAFVKALALHGLGLNLYAGEDLPNENDGKQELKDNKSNNRNQNQKAPANRNLSRPAPRTEKDKEIEELHKEIKPKLANYAKMIGFDISTTGKMVFETNNVDMRTKNVTELKNVIAYLDQNIEKALANQKQVQGGVSND